MARGDITGIGGGPAMRGESPRGEGIAGRERKMG